MGTTLDYMKWKYLNKRFQTNQGEWFIVIEYFNSKNITIQFDDETKMFHQQSSHINSKNIRKINSVIPTFENVGITGIGKFDCYHFLFNCWKNMIQRNYSKNTQLNQPTYIDCSVDPIWFNFQVFAEWGINSINGYEEGFCLDKDILIKNNKIYGPDTCCFVPKEINNLFLKHQNARGEYPIGVSYEKNTNKYKSSINIYNKQINLGRFNTPKEAFQAYKIAKENYIKEIADKWKDKITDKVYQALYNYQVEITD